MGAPGLAPGVLAAFLLAAPARAQTLSGVSIVTLQATKVSALTVVIGSGSSMNFSLLQGAIANGSTAAAITTSWSVNPGQIGTVRVYGYFSTPSAALAGATMNIPSNYVEGRVTTGVPTTYTPIAQTNPVGPAGGSLLLVSETITGVNKSKTRTDNLDLRVNLTTSPPVPAGNYNGTLRIQVRAF
ncbi:MAG TPA: hypothetical protein VFS09_08035 [Candidatus Eisenbacteria bacterium]|nr:hypothetical protein [Candidatus Eisenbacteria bacterium]